MTLRPATPPGEPSYIVRMLRAAALLGGVQVLRLVLLLIRNKALALWLGPAGLGVLSQLNGIADTASLICTAGLGAAVARFVAADPAVHRAGASAGYQDVSLGEASAEDVARVGAVVIGAGALLMTGLLVVLQAKVAEIGAGNALYAGLLVIMAGTVPLNAVYQWCAAVLQGVGSVRGQAVQSGINAVLWLVCAVVLVRFYGLPGGVCGIALAWIGSALASLAVLRSQGLNRFLKLPDRKLSPADRELAARMLKFGGVALAGALSPLLIVVGTRATLIHWGGPLAAGLYQVPVSMSNLSFQPLTVVLSGFALPHLYRHCKGADTDWARLHAEMESTLLLIVGALTPIIAFLLLMRHALTHWLFSAKFAPAAAMIPPQLAADYFDAIAWWLAMPLLPLHRYREALTIDVASVVLAITASWLLLPRFGLMGAPLGTVCAQLVVLCCLLVLRVRGDGLVVRPKTLALVAAGSATILALTLWSMRTA